MNYQRNSLKGGKICSVVNYVFDINIRGMMIMVTCLISMLVLTVLYILYFIMVEVIVMNDNTASASSKEVEISDIERGNGKPFTRLRRITGYLADASSFNNGKRAELKDRVKHASAECGCGCR